MKTAAAKHRPITEEIAGQYLFLLTRMMGLIVLYEEGNHSRPFPHQRELEALQIISEDFLRAHKKGKQRKTS